MAHLKGLRAPKFWRVGKQRRWVVSPRPGPHPKFFCIPLLLLLRDFLRLVELGDEARKIIKQGNVLVDGRVCKDPKFPVGLFDVVSLPQLQKNFRVVAGKKGLELVEIGEEEARKKVCRIKNKTNVKGNKFQLTLHDGKNVLTTSKEFRVGDSLLLELPSCKIVEHLKLEKGVIGLVVKGRKAGEEVRVVGLVRKGMKNLVSCELDEQTIEVPKERLIDVGRDKPLITVHAADAQSAA